MTEAVQGEYKFQRGSLKLIPYDIKVANIPEEALLTLYNRLKEENLLSVVFHEGVDVSLLQFMNYFSGGRGLLQILAISDPAGAYYPAGMAWLSDIVVCSGVIMKGVGAFVFFKDYMKPVYTDPFSEIILDYWFNGLGMNIILGATPEPNRAALLYVKRSGFKEVARIPEYTTFKGEVVTGVITYMTKTDYQSLVREPHGIIRAG